MRFLLILLATAAFASQSFVLTSGRRVTTTFPSGSPMCQNVTAFRAEGHFEIKATPVSADVIHRQDTSWELNLSSTGNLGTLVLNTGGGPFVNIAGWAYVRWRFQRFTSPAEYTIEVTNEQTGEVRTATAVDSNPGSTNPAGCAFYTGAQAGNPATVNVGAVRIYSSTVALGSAPPARLLTSGFADLLDLEFEGNLNDSSGRGLTSSMSEGSADYDPTVALPPVVSVVAPTTVRTNTAASITGTCLSNEDDPACTVFWAQVGGPALGRWTGQTTLTPTFTGPRFGQYDLRVQASTSTQIASTDLALGAVATDASGAVVVPDADINAIIGPIIRSGANPWDWYDTRDVYSGQFQIDQQTGANGALAFWSRENWATNLAGTISVTNGSEVITGSGTQFQTDFCGGPGNTTPASTYNQIYIKYEMAEYPASTTLARYNVVTCTSQTSMTVNAAWGHASGTQSGLNYARADAALAGFWTNTNTPGNYYDNVLAFYIMYYRTGLTKYRDAARNLARGWWEGPFYGRGKNYDTAALGGNFVSAGPARGQAITGLILWALDTGENIWPGLVYVMDYQRDVGWGFFNTRSWDPALISVGDLREQAYLVAAYSLYARFAMTSPGVPDAATRATYRQYVKDYVNLLLEPLQHPTGEWRWVSVQNLNVSGTPYVTVTNGSTSVSLTGTTWSAGNFCVNDCDAGAYQAWLWFFTARSNSELPGKQNSDLGGDTVLYKFTSVTSTTGTLDRPYEGTSGDKGMVASSLAGFGNQPFMQAIMVGALGTYAYDTLTFYGDTAEATKARTMAALGAQWLRSSDAYNAAGYYLYGGSLFLNCAAAPTSTGCAGDTVLNGEGMKGLTAVHLAAPSSDTLTQGDNWYNAIWCKPTGGFTCPIASFGTYGNYIDDIGVSGAFMNNPVDPLTNKWFGFFFGYGGGASWPVARAGGLAPADVRTLNLLYSLPSNADTAVARVIRPDGSSQDFSCTAGACAINYDARQGSTILTQMRYSMGSDLVAAGELTPRQLQ